MDRGMVQGFAPITIGLTAASLLASTAGVWGSIRIAHRAGLMDVPNERSSHTVPTPRLGGVPMVLAVVLSFWGWAHLVAGEAIALKGLPFCFLFACFISLLGLWDDISGLGPLTRFLVQMFTALLFLWTWTGFISNSASVGIVLPQLIWILVGSVGIVWMVNLYNFMDGIDGLAGGEAAVSSSFFFLLFAHHGETGWAAANLFVAAASMGFLVHNWPPARVFMGDAGSAFLGAFYGIQSVIAAITTPLPFMVLLLPFSNFILDATFTLMRRIWNGEQWYRPHKSHYYQRMTRLGMTHRTVTALELISVALSCGAAWLYDRSGKEGRIMIPIVVLLGFLACGVWIRGKERIRTCVASK